MLFLPPIIPKHLSLLGLCAVTGRIVTLAVCSKENKEPLSYRKIDTICVEVRATKKGNEIPSGSYRIGDDRFMLKKIQSGSWKSNRLTLMSLKAVKPPAMYQFLIEFLELAGAY